MGFETDIILKNHKINSQITQMLPEELVRRLKMLPINIEGSNLYVAVTEPINLPGMDEIKSLTGLKVKPVIVPYDELMILIKTQLRTDHLAKQTIADMTFEGLASTDTDTEFDPILDVEEAPVVSLVNSIIEGGVNEGASDIHMEPQYPEMRVRYRVHGILQNIARVPKNIEPAVISRIKLLADMDIAERRRPQDGHISMEVSGRLIDFRVSSIHTVKGEKIVIRILDKQNMMISLEQLGMLPEQQKIFESFISRPHGIILVTGPTGSGKTTTLYAALGKFDALERNIVTIENPVEYQLDDINQIQTNTYINFDFANALRTIVRQDPDIILIGEIRDFETAEIAVQSALTGHLVLSTLHTNDAPSAIVRLTDMEIQPFLITSTVRGIIAQRLVRSICTECKEEYIPTIEELHLMNLPESSDIKFSRGKGCPSCHYTGYSGRTGIFEVFEINEGVRKLILENVSSNELRQLAIANGMKTLSQVGREKILLGITTVEEVQKIVYIGKED